MLPRRAKPERNLNPRPTSLQLPSPRAFWAIAALFVLGLAAYWSSLRYPLVFDDVQLSERFMRSYGAAWFRLEPRWFSYSSFGWNYRIFGSDVLWFRLGNVLLHAGVAAMLFVFLRRLFAALLPAGRPPDPAWWAFFGALIFLIHPVAVYGVAYLVQRSIIMATLFSLVSLCCFLEGLLRGSRRWYLAAAAAYFAAVFSKEHAVMLPAVAATLALLVRGPSLRLVREVALPLALYAAVGLLIVFQVRGLLGVQYEPHAEAAMRQLAESRVEASLAAPAPEAPGSAAQGAAGRHPLSVINQGYLFFRYLLTWLVPLPAWMSIDVRVPFPQQLASWPQAAGFAAWLLWPAVGLWLLLKRGRAGLAGFALLAPWLLGLTEMASVRIQEVFVLYRSYLWMCLLPAALPAVLGRLPARWALAAMCAASLALLPAFYDRLASFSSEIVVWDDALRKNRDLAAPFAERAWRSRGIAYYKSSRYDEALADFERALQIAPRSADVWMARGTLFMRTAHTERALADFDRALELDPRHFEVLGRRCVVRMRLKRLDAALDDCLKAAELWPYDPDNFTSLGMVYALRGEAARSEEQYRRALGLDAPNGDAHYQFGVLLRATGRTEDARRHFSAACQAKVERACAAAK
jgi:tetratricopeptide (TPR) repeat protein